MKSKKRFLCLISVFLLASAMLIGCGSSEEEINWGDKYKALIESGEGTDFKDFDQMKEDLDEIRKETGATYVYMMSPSKDGKASLDGVTDRTGSFLITIDGSEEPDDWGADYGWEIQFEEAWNGEAAAARSAWNDEPGEICWSAFAPIYDSEGKVVGILGIDYPANEIADFAKWNRDVSEWNKIEESLDGVDIPKDVQKIMDKVTKLADENAKDLTEKNM